MPIELKPTTWSIKLEKQLEEEVLKVIKKTLLFPIARAWQRSKHNSKATPLQEALKSGEVLYTEGLFSGRFTSEVAEEIRNLGGIYNQKSKTYSLIEELLPQETKDIISKALENNLLASKRMLETINGIELTHILDHKTFEPTFNKILKDITKKTRATFNVIPKEQKKVGVYFDFTEEQQKAMSQAYSNNMKSYIKKFTEEQRQILLQAVENNIAQGKLAKNLESFILERFNVSKNKAKFLARQETSLCTTAQKVILYKEQGLEDFKWKAVQDSKTRRQHKEWHNHIFKIDKPPYDDIENEALLPGQAYNCRCTMSPILDN